MTNTPIPPGFALVPIEPTPEMLQRGANCQEYAHDDVYEATAETIYRAMLAAAPAVSAPAVPNAWVRWEWNRTGGKSLVFEKPAELSLSEEARGVVYDPLYAAPAAAPAWQPIETAPMGGESVLVHRKGDIWPGVAYAISGRWHWSDSGRWAGYPTHWIPLPAAPEIQCAATAAGSQS